MAYTLTPFQPNTPYENQVETELNLANSNFTILSQAFVNNDPTQAIKRAVYIGTTAPTGQVWGMLWYNTNDLLLRIYTNSGWRAINDTSDINTEITNIKSAFFSNSPSYAIKRAVYVGSSAPSSSDTGTLWFDTSNSTIKIRNVGAWKDLLNASGDAPVYGCRAWVNFNSTTNPPTIRASGNVSSIVKNGVGDYTINFITPMPDTNYVSVFGGRNNEDGQGVWLCEYGDQNSQGGKTTTSLRVRNINSAHQLSDIGTFMVAIFR